MIFCVEDDPSIRELVIYTLQSTGYDAQGFADGAALFAALGSVRPDLLLLDIMLPGEEDGLAILRRLRAAPATRSLPVILVTAKGTEFDKVTGLDSGADDYLAKPFGMMELVSRVRAVLRRSAPASQPAELTAGPISLNEPKHTVTVGHRPVALTFKEFSLLRHLMAQPGRVFSRDQLLEELWGYDFDGETRTVDVHVRTLRQKLGPAGALIETVRGVGYRMGDGHDQENL